MYMNINIEHYMLFYVDILNCMINDHNCTQICVEVEGSFNCSCFPSYELEEDEVTCTGIVIIKLENRWKFIKFIVLTYV